MNRVQVLVVEEEEKEEGTSTRLLDDDDGAGTFFMYISLQLQFIVLLISGLHAAKDGDERQHNIRAVLHILEFSYGTITFSLWVFRSQSSSAIGFYCGYSGSLCGE